MDKWCRGIACIINVFRTRGQSPRHGTDVDRDRLMNLFQQLHFRALVFNDEDGLQAEVSYLLVNCPTIVCNVCNGVQSYHNLIQNHSMSDNFHVETAKSCT